MNATSILRTFATVLIYSASLSATAQSAAPTSLGLNNPGARCSSMVSESAVSNLPNGNVHVLEARLVTTEEQPFVEHCLIDAEINPRIGVDGQRYSIRFRLRLPTNSWNERLYMRGGGGTNGSLTDPYDLLEQGYATLGTDSGHDNQLNFDADAGGTAAFGLDADARIDFAYRSYDQVVQVGKALIQLFYGEEPVYSYFEGCSEGGREAFLMAQRFPEHINGIIAGAPAFHLGLGPVAGIYTTQLFAGLALRQNQILATGEPAIGLTSSDSDLMIVRGAVLAACDTLDGLEDGVVDDPYGCQSELVEVHLDQIVCEEDKDLHCLTVDQIDTLKLAFAGPRDSSGRSLYSDWPWDGGISGFDGEAYSTAWRSQWLGPYGDQNLAGKLVYAPAVAVIYSTPPQLPISRERALEFSLEYDFDTDVSLIYAKDSSYGVSGADMFADSTDLSAFYEKGGKMMIYHGASDASISMNDTLNWFLKLNEDMDGKNSEFVQFYPVPGMGHCRRGPATDEFSMLSDVRNWVEKGEVPDGVYARASEPGYFGVEEHSRLICPFPTIASYRGEGSINEASSFVCEARSEADR